MNKEARRKARRIEGQPKVRTQVAMNTGSRRHKSIKDYRRKSKWSNPEA
jgi:hypothetical protein